MDTTPGAPEQGPGRAAGAPLPDATRRAIVVAGIAAVATLAAWSPVLRLSTLAGAGDWGSDWLWLADGLDRLGRGLPLNHPAYVTAPFSQLEGGPAYTWSLHPPWNATLVAPMLLIPADLRVAAWTAIMTVALAAAVALAWPRRAWWGSSLLIAAAVLGPPFGGLWEGLVDQVHYANPNALVLLGVVLVWAGRRERRASLIAVGLVLAAVKVVPAAGMAVWLLAARTGRPTALRGLLLAAGVLACLTIPIILLDPGALGDTIAVALNVVPWDGPGNLAPQVRLSPLLGPEAAVWVSRTVALAILGVVLLRRLDGPGGFVLAAAAPLLLTPQLWAHWLLIPAIALIAALDASAWFARVDRAVRTAGSGTNGRRPGRGVPLSPG